MKPLAEPIDILMTVPATKGRRDFSYRAVSEELHLVAFRQAIGRAPATLSRTPTNLRLFGSACLAQPSLICLDYRGVIQQLRT
jgi:hypothetical protein